MSSAIVVAAMAALAFCALSAAALDTSQEPSPVSSSNDAPFYAFKIKSLEGADVDFGQYRGKVSLVVNTASKCGFTPQYGGLEALYQKYSAQGLVVLGFPCNQFGSQEPGSAAEIATFCQKNFGVSFPLFEKIDVNGKRASPLYVFLKQAAPNDHSNIKWNFTKFLVGRDGQVLKRYGAMEAPQGLERDIEKALAVPVPALTQPPS